MVLLLSLGIGFVTGLRSLMGLATLSWGARLGWVGLNGTGAAFMALPGTTAILTLAAVGELVGDKLAITPSRKSPGPFAARVVIGGLCGAVVALAAGASPILGAGAGGVGAIAGTLGGYAYRVAAVRRFQISDFPFALFEDLAAIGLGLFLVSQVP